jgi:vanillate/3-O-methylgallate O-demethylase
MAPGSKNASLQNLLDSTPNLVEYFYNDTLPPHSRDRPGFSPVPPEFTNWREEQRAWQASAILFDQTHHMPEMFVQGPDAFRLLNHIGINSFANFKPGMAKQYIGCAPSGHVIGDCILFYLAANSFELVSNTTLHDWVEFNARDGRYDVTIEREAATTDPSKARKQFRFELDGPAAGQIFGAVVQGNAPDIPFFRTTTVTIAGHPVLALRHGMAGHTGVELAGPYEHGPAVRAAILNAGARYGLRQGGTRAYFSTPIESGWMAYPMPAIYTHKELRAFREWLPADSWAGKTQLAGSFYSPNIEDYYNTPWDLGYGRFVKLDHDFVGRAALEKMATQKHRAKVSLIWNPDEVTRIVGSLMGSELPYRYLNFPTLSYGFPQCDEVRGGDGRLVGFCNHTAYIINAARVISLAWIDEEQAKVGNQVQLVWGEPNGGSRKPQVERHRQTMVRATVAPAPYSDHVRQMQRATITAK